MHRLYKSQIYVHTVTMRCVIWNVETLSYAILLYIKSSLINMNSDSNVDLMYIISLPSNVSYWCLLLQNSFPTHFKAGWNCGTKCSFLSFLKTYIASWCYAGYYIGKIQCYTYRIFNDTMVHAVSVFVSLFG